MCLTNLNYTDYYILLSSSLMIPKLSLPISKLFDQKPCLDSRIQTTFVYSFIDTDSLSIGCASIYAKWMREKQQDDLYGQMHKCMNEFSHTSFIFLYVYRALRSMRTSHDSNAFCLLMVVVHSKPIIIITFRSNYQTFTWMGHPNICRHIVCVFVCVCETTAQPNNKNINFQSDKLNETTLINANVYKMWN